MAAESAGPDGALPEAAGSAHPGWGSAGQFQDRARESEASLLGMWVFLASEALFFGTLFAAYAVYRTFYGEAFRQAGQRLDAGWGAANTAILLISSAAVAMAVRACEAGKAKAAALWFYVAAGLGMVFLAIKGHEYRLDWLRHLVPWRDRVFAFPGNHAGQARLFFDLYFAMTGLHALHLLIGIGLSAAAGWRARRRIPMTMARTVGLYWHFVDMIWVFLFPLFYLMGR